ncbi:hypothetical protein AYO38_00680, partial [bacterium SCGC AG-212-C10]
ESPRPSSFPRTAEGFNAASQDRFPGLIGMEVLELRHGMVRGRLTVRPGLWAPNGFLHAATVVGLADTLCGYGCTASLPEGATGFTTVELKSNFLGTLREGVIEATATMTHGGRTTQVWDATVTDAATGKAIALFRCTQMVLYPR